MEFKIHLTIESEEIKEALEEELGREPTLDEYEEFLSYLEIDVADWLRENAKTFLRDKTP
jgi:hypothetical protein